MADDSISKLHPDRAAEERELRNRNRQALADHGHRRNGTAATHAGAAQTRPGALARLHRSGAISNDQLGWALEIAAEHERIDREVGMAAMSWDVRVDTGVGADRAFESLGRVRRAQAYRQWWASLIVLCSDLPKITAAASAASHVLAMIVDDLGVTWAAKRLRVGVARMRKLLEDALDLWPKKLVDARNAIREDDLIVMELRLR